MKSRKEQGQDHILGISSRIFDFIFLVPVKHNPYIIIEMLKGDTIEICLKVLIYE